MTPNVFSMVFKTKTKTGAMLLSLLVIFGVVLSACGGGSANKSAGGTSALTIVTSPNGDFTKAFGPYAANGAPGANGMIYETLLYFNTLDGSVKPWLASSYQFSSDSKSLTFNVRPNVKWSDGQPFTADDVAFSFNVLKQYPAADTNGLWSYFQTVTATNDHTVVITLKQAYSPVLWYAGGQTYMIPKHVFSTVGDPTKYANTNPVGTGPYTLKGFTPQLITYTKNPNYWQPGKPAVTELRYPAYNSNTSVELDLDRGNLDWAGLFTPKINDTFVAKDPTHNHYWFPPRNVVMLYLNLTESPFNQLPVRQAISMVMDKAQMYKVAESGYEPPASPTGLILPNNNSYLSPDYQSLQNTVDTAKATQLIEGAGFTKGSDGIYVGKDGKKLSFNVDVVSGWTDWVTLCQIVAANLKTIGINVTVNAVSFNSYFSAIQTGKFDMAVSWSAVGPNPFFYYNSLLNSKNSAPVGQNASTNWERYNDTNADQLLKQYATTTSDSVQKQAIQGLQKIMVEKIPSVPLVYGANWYEYNTSRFTGWPDTKNPYASPSPFTYPDAEVVVLNLKPVH